VTGHPLGAALSSLVAFYLACEDDIPKPVTCLNFASPRIGDSGFRDAVRWLEPRKMLRMLRGVVYVSVSRRAFSTSSPFHVTRLCNHLPFCLCSNEGDSSISTFPITNYYHVGMQIRLYKTDDKPPVVTYSSKTVTWGATFSRIWAYK
jgi:hypothetical protein